ncbi:MAG: hypothetical protein KatS3mg054_0629 [Chloroflexus sp.]|nr:MAG: hypothetical protein KatS3mg054_0629 [Chloroflexus sp.]
MMPQLVVYFRDSDIWWIDGRLWLYPYQRDRVCWWTWERLLMMTRAEYERK